MINSVCTMIHGGAGEGQDPSRCPTVRCAPCADRWRRTRPEDLGLRGRVVQLQQVEVLRTEPRVGERGPRRDGHRLRPESRARRQPRGPDGAPVNDQRQKNRGVTLGGSGMAPICFRSPSMSEIPCSSTS